MDWAFEQRFDPGGRQLDEFLRQREDLAHADADEHIAFAVLTFPALEIALDLAQFLIGLVLFQPLDECGRGAFNRVGRHGPRHQESNVHFVAPSVPCEVPTPNASWQAIR